MPVDLHLFSSPGEDDIRFIVEASRPYLDGKAGSSVAYLPLASLFAERWQKQTEEAFQGLGRLETVNAELMTQEEIEARLRTAALAYIPGGNTFLLGHRMHLTGVMPYLRKKVQGGLPVVAFSAGTILCGPNILTSSDMNTAGTGHFEGLNATPFNFMVHYARDAYGQSLQDEWLADYHFFHDNPVLLLSDGAYLRVQGRKTWLVRGEAWVLRKDSEKQRWESGERIDA
jgi:dipeptidase E